MINLRVDTIEGRDGNNGPIFEGNLEFSSTAHLVLPKGTTGERPVGVSTGAMRYNTDTSNVEYYNGTSWVEVSSYDNPPCALEQAARPARATVRSPKSVAFPVVAMVI